jgi:hypothetical protein
MGSLLLLQLLTLLGRCMPAAAFFTAASSSACFSLKTEDNSHQQVQSVLDRCKAVQGELTMI